MTQPCLTPVVISKLSVRSPNILTVPSIPSCNDTMMLVIFGGMPLFRRTHHRALGEIDKNSKEVHVLFDALFLKLADYKDRVCCASSTAEATL